MTLRRNGSIYSRTKGFVRFWRWSHIERGSVTFEYITRIQEIT